MKKWNIYKKLMGSAMALLLTCSLMPASSVHAAETYTVTYRPGNVGQFAVAQSSDKTAKELAQEVADVLYGNYQVTVTEHGAIKVEVPKGAQVPQAPAYIVPETGYFVRSWGPAEGDVVTKNVDYVADYGRLTDGVEYTIRYVDEQSGESIAPFVTAYANKGEELSVTAPSTISTSNAGIYGLTAKRTQKLVLSEDADKNVITFTYLYNYDPGTVEEEIVVTVPGEVTNVTEAYTTYVDGGTTTVGGATQQNVAANNAAAGNVDAGVVNDAEAEEEGLAIEDTETPLVESPDQEEEVLSEDVVSIDEENAPLANLKDQGGFNSVVVLAGVFAVAAMAMAVIWLQMRKKQNNVEEE